MTVARSIILLFLLTLATGCVTNPVTGDRDFVTMTEEEEIRQGRNFHFQILKQYGVYEDKDLQQYVNRIGQALAAESHRSHLKYTFTVLDSPDINAFALPGGYIYITRGIMAYLNSEAELAGVLGHEIGHVTARHSVRQQSGQMASQIFGVLVAATTGNSALTDISQAVGTGLVRGYGREHELEADRLGAEYLHQIGFDPDTMLEVIGVLKDQEVYERARAKQENREPRIYHGVYSTHPRNDDRLKTVVRAARKLSEREYRDPNTKGYLAMIDGMAWGKNVREGVVEGNQFKHPDLRFAIEIPKQWAHQNQPDFLYLLPPGKNGIIRIGATEQQNDESLTQMLRRLTGDKSLDVNKEDLGVSARLQVKTSGGRDPARMHLLPLRDQQVLVLLGAGREEAFDTIAGELGKVVNSFTRLKREQAAAVRQPRLKIIEPGRGQSFQSLAGEDYLGSDPVGRLRVLNRSFPEGDPSALPQIKVISVDDS